MSLSSLRAHAGALLAFRFLSLTSSPFPGKAPPSRLGFNFTFFQQPFLIHLSDHSYPSNIHLFV